MVRLIFLYLQSVEEFPRWERNECIRIIQTEQLHRKLKKNIEKENCDVGSILFYAVTSRNVTN